MVDAAAHPFGYTGRRWDADLGIYYYRARWYDPELGTFLETDPVGQMDYINLYSYVGLDPMDLTDPTGMQTVPLSGMGYSAEEIGYIHDGYRSIGNSIVSWLSTLLIGQRLSNDSYAFAVAIANQSNSNLNSYQRGVLNSYAYDAFESASAASMSRGQALSNALVAATFGNTLRTAAAESLFAQRA